MSKPILLLYPPFEGKNYLTSRAPFPIGPLYIAAFLEKHGWHAKVKDFSYPPNRSKTDRPAELQTKQSIYVRYGATDKDMYYWLETNLPDYYHVVGVSSLMSSNWTGAYNLIRIIKQVKPDTTIVLGGPHATAFPEHVTQKSKADFVCIGEGEECFLHFLQGELQEGIIPVGKKKTVRTSFTKNLTDLPFPERRLLRDDRKMKEIYVTFSRGCPHKCSFCGSYLIQGRRWRHKSVGRCLEELGFYYFEWGIRRFVVEDDNPCPGAKGVRHLKALCYRIARDLPKIRLTISHGIPIYAVSDQECAELLWAAGFRHMVFPLESTDPAVLKDMNKPFILKHWKQALENWKMYESRTPHEIILGYPFVETIHSMLQTMIDIADVGGLIWASHFRLNRGTPLFDRCLEAGYVDKNYDPINTQAFFLETERFTMKDLKELMQISRGLNFATETGYNPLRSVFDVDHPSFHSFTVPEKEGDPVVRGKFKFRRSQNVAAMLMLTATGHFSGKPHVIYEDDETLIFRGEKPSRVYDELRQILTNKKRCGIREII